MIERINEYPASGSPPEVVSSRSRFRVRLASDYVEAVALSIDPRALAQSQDADAIGLGMASQHFTVHAGRRLSHGRRALEQASIRAEEHGLTAVLEPTSIERPGRSSRSTDEELDEARWLSEESLCSVPDRVRLGGDRADQPCPHRVPRGPARRGRKVKLGGSSPRFDAPTSDGGIVDDPCSAWSLGRADGELGRRRGCSEQGTGFLETAGVRATMKWTTPVRRPCHLLHPGLRRQNIGALLDEGRRPGAWKTRSAASWAASTAGADVPEMIGSTGWHRRARLSSNRRVEQRARAMSHRKPDGTVMATASAASRHRSWRLVLFERDLFALSAFDPLVRHWVTPSHEITVGRSSLPPTPVARCTTSSNDSVVRSHANCRQPSRAPIRLPSPAGACRRC